MSYSRVTLTDGTALSVFDHGQGGTPLLFIHGSSCDHTFLAPQIEHFAASRRVIAPDLRGHGASAKPEEGYTFANMADDLAGMLAALDAPPAVAVGHSMGGMIALELCQRHPGRVAALACLDSTLLSPPGGPSRARTLIEGLKSTAWQSYFIRYFEAAFAPFDDPERRQAILDRMLTTPQHVVVSIFEQVKVADGSQALRACRAPMLYVAAARPRTDLQRLRELCPQLVTGQVVASGHFMTLEVPAQVNAMLERFLAVNGL